MKKGIKKTEGYVTQKMLDESRIVGVLEAGGVAPYISTMAKYFKCSHTTMKKFIDKSPAIQELMNETEKELSDLATIVIKNVLKGSDKREAATMARWVKDKLDNNYKNKQEQVKMPVINIVVKDAPSPTVHYIDVEDVKEINDDDKAEGAAPSALKQ